MPFYDPSAADRRSQIVQFHLYLGRVADLIVQCLPIGSTGSSFIAPCACNVPFSSANYPETIVGSEANLIRLIQLFRH